MNTRPIEPATIDFDDAQAPRAPRFGDTYHSRSGAAAQARHVFLAGNGLPRRWQQREHFSILETGFGLGHNFLATWSAWRDDPARCARLHFFSIERHPPVRDDLARAHRSAGVPALAGQLVQAWPALTPNLHRLAFEDGRVELLLALGDVAQWLPEVVGRFDAFFLDGFAPSRNPEMWQRRVLVALGRLAAPGATAATWSVAHEVRDGLIEAGFEVARAPGLPPKREMTTAAYAPRFEQRRPPGREWPSQPSQPVAVIGAGLAGCAAAEALAQAGIDCTVFERHPEAAQETSGQRGGIFHGVVHTDDGPHARWGRAAALMARDAVARAVRQHGVAGHAQGLLRVDDHPVAWLRERGAQLGLPPDYVQALDERQMRERSGLPIHKAGWLYPGGGWVDPVGLCRAWLDHPDIRWCGNIAVASLARLHDGWQLLDADGGIVAHSPTVVLANAAGVLPLLGWPAWPLHRRRGQTGWLDAATPGLVHPRLPIAGAGYALPTADGGVLFGATSQLEDDDARIRTQDHRDNLERLAQLSGTAPLPPGLPMHARVGWRLVADDRLPVIGAVPDETLALPNARLEQPRFVPRRAGLFVFCALASRGLSWAPLGARLLAAQIAGTPCPVESSLIDAVDPARFLSRRLRRAL